MLETEVLDTRIDIASVKHAGFEIAMGKLLHALDTLHYAFVAPTPATHARVVARDERRTARDLTGVFGWSLPFDEAAVAVPLLDELRTSGIVVTDTEGQARSRFRVSRLHGTLFAHSAYPTSAANSVFLGPDSYRFADFIVAQMPRRRGALRIVDYGTGAGVGGIVAATNATEPDLLLADINPDALALAQINARHAGLTARTTQVQAPDDLDSPFDLIVTHPPFMIDAEARAYRDGGGLYGAQLSRDWVIAGLRKLAPGGKLIMHTGAPIVDGEDVLLAELRKRMPAVDFALEYRELDPDIFGDELEKPEYAEVDRIAAVGAVVTRSAA